MHIQSNASTTVTVSTTVSTSAASAASTEVNAASSANTSTATTPMPVELPAVMQADRLSEVLIAFGLKPTDDKLKLLMLMLENEIPVTKENLTKLNQALKLLGSENTDKAIFLIKNDIKLNTDNAQTLNGLSSGSIKLTSQLAQLAEALNLPVQTATSNQAPAQSTQPKLLQATPQNPQQTSTTVTTQNTFTVEIKETFQSSTAKELAKPEYLQTNQSQSESIGELIKQEMSKPLTNGTNAVEQNLKHTVASVVEHNVQVTVTKQTEVSTKVQTTGKDTVPQQEQPPQKLQSSSELSKEAVTIPTQQPQASSTISTTLPTGVDRQAILAEKSIVEEILEKSEKTDNVSKPVPMPDIPIASKEELIRKELGQRINRLTLDVSKKKPEEISRLIQEIREIIREVRQIPDTKLETVANKVENTLNFLDQVKTATLFHIPLLIEQKPVHAELYVFKDKRKKTKKNASSALIALDTLNMGRFEAYVQKNERDVSIQFRLENDRIEKLVRSNAKKLKDLLADYNYKLSDYTFKSLTEAYSLLNQEKELKELDRTLDVQVNFDFKA